MTEIEPVARSRPIRFADGSPDVTRLGTAGERWRDLYHFALQQSWPGFFGVLIGFYTMLNVVFATLYWLSPGAIGETHPGNWLEDFFFSFETIATVGYGVMHPMTLYAHVVVICEIMVGVLAVPLLTGLTIAKFARPTARVTFSRNVLVTRYDGVPTLMFRVANLRANQIFETRINLTMLRLETTLEGRVIRRLIDLKPVRDTNPMFVLSWSVMHRIDQHSPLYGIDLAAIAPGDIEFMAVMTGLDATTSATVHARHVYEIEDLLLGHVFEDIILPGPDGRMAIDYRRLHLVRAEVPPLEPSPGHPSAPALNPAPSPEYASPPP